MKKGILVIAALAAILVVGGIGMIVSIDYSNQVQDSTPYVRSTSPPKITQIIAVEELTANHNMTDFVIDIMIKNYDIGDKELSSLDRKLGFQIQDYGIRYGFVIDSNNYDIVAHFNPDLVGENIFELVKFEESQEQIIETLKSDKEVWVHYEFLNPETDKKESKTSLFKMYDNLIFGSGFYD